MPAPSKLRKLSERGDFLQGSALWEFCDYPCLVVARMTEQNWMVQIMWSLSLVTSPLAIHQSQYISEQLQGQQFQSRAEAVGAVQLAAQMWKETDA